MDLFANTHITKTDLLDSITLLTSIHSDLRNRTLKRGTIIALIGLLPMFYGGLFLNAEILAVWGLPIVLFGFSLLAFGMIPYRKLTRLEKNPRTLIITEETLHYIIKGKIPMKIPCKSIERIQYRNDPDLYGIEIWVKEKCCFFPYFSKRSYNQLVTLLPERCHAS